MRLLYITALLLLLVSPAIGQVKYKLKTFTPIDVFEDPDKNTDPDALTYKKIGSVPTGDTVILIEHKLDLWKIKHNELEGYIYDMFVASDDPIIVKLIEESRQAEEKRQLAIEKKELEDAEKTLKELDAELAKLKRQLKTELTKKYGSAVAARLFKEEIWIGMSKQMTIDSIGRPLAINKTTTKLGISEEWVYRSKLLIFKNGKLEKITEVF